MNNRVWDQKIGEMCRASGLGGGQWADVARIINAIDGPPSPGRIPGLRRPVRL